MHTNNGVLSQLGMCVCVCVVQVIIDRSISEEVVLSNISNDTLAV